MPPQRQAKFVICHLCHSASGDCLDLMNVAGTFVPFLPSINPKHSRQISHPGQLLTFWQSSGSEILLGKRLLFLLIRLQMACFLLYLPCCRQGWTTEWSHAKSPKDGVFKIWKMWQVMRVLLKKKKKKNFCHKKLHKDYWILSSSL